MLWFIHRMNIFLSTNKQSRIGSNITGRQQHYQTKQPSRAVGSNIAVLVGQYILPDWVQYILAKPYAIAFTVAICIDQPICEAGLSVEVMSCAERPVSAIRRKKVSLCVCAR